jgi:hypothetical protein
MRKNFFKKKLASSLALAMVVTSLTVPTSASAATTVKIVKEGGGAAPSILYVGDKVDLGLSKTVKGYKYTWTVSDSSIATINKKGVVTPKAPGKVTAKITARNSKGKWVASYKQSIKVKLRATSVDIGADDFTLVIGQDKDLNAVKTPAKSTDVLKYVSDNPEVATVDAKTGVVKAVGAGEATITVLSKATSKSADNSKYNRTDSVKVTVVDGIQAVKQTTPNKFELTFGTDQHEKLTKDQLTVTDANGVKQVIKDISFDESGKVATVTLFIDLVDKATYKVTYDKSEKTFVASVGEVASIQLSGKTVQYNKPTALDVKLLDANGVDVTKTDALQNNVTFTVDESKGYVLWNDETKKYEITIYNYPESVTVKATYHTYTYDGANEKTYESSAVINSVKEIPNQAKDITYTLAKDKADWTKLNTTIPAESTGYQLFLKAKDIDTDKDLTEADFDFDTSDASILTVVKSDAGVYVYPVKTGSAYVKATYGQTVKMLPVTIGAKAKVTSVSASTNSVSLSDATDLGGDSATITFTVKDQYGNEPDYKTSGETITVVPISEKASVNGKTDDVINYLPENNKLTFSLVAGKKLDRTAVNTYKVTYYDRTFNISVTATKVDDSSTVSTIKVERDVDSVDLAVKDGTTVEDKTIKFTVYGLNSSGQKITKINNAKLQFKLGSDDKGTVTAKDGVATFGGLTTKTVESKTVFTKADTGVYTVIVTDPTTKKQTSTSFKLSDSQLAPTFTLEKATVDRYSTLRAALPDVVKITSKYDSYEIGEVEAMYGKDSIDLDTPLNNKGSVYVKSITIYETVGSTTFATKIKTETSLSVVE